MKYILPIIAAVAISTPVWAQTPPTNPDPQTPAVTSSDATQPAEPAKGANSFTQEQAKERIEARGFADVTGLAKDQDGIWRGKAMKNGASHDVALDYQGNVFPN